MARLTDEIAGEAIRKRIRQQLSHSEHIQQAGLTHSTSYRSVNTMPRNETESKDSVGNDHYSGAYE